MQTIKPNFIAYIDESGDEGFSFSKGSSKWFVLSAAVFRAANDRIPLDIADNVRIKLGKPPTKDLHFVNLKHSQRVAYVDEIGSNSLRCITVAIHKPSITERSTFQFKNRLYHYAIRMLIERISWLCTSTAQDNDSGLARLIFSHRRNLSYKDVRTYIERLRNMPTEIDWNAIDPANVTALVHKQRKGLWIADAIASSFFCGLELDRLGYTEGKYAQRLRKTVWNRNGNYLGTGIKFWPQEYINAIDLEDNHKWLKDVYNIEKK